MIGALVGCGVGLVIGVGLDRMLHRRWRWKRPLSTPADPGFTEADREQLSKEFAVHAAAVRRQVSEFADALADGDQLLRARLRVFEQGGRP